MEWPSVLPFVKRQLQDSFSSEENTVSSTYFLLVGGEPAGLIQTSSKEYIQHRKNLFPCIGPLFCGATLPPETGFGEKLLARARFELGRKGFDSAYFTSGSYRLL